MKYYGKEKCRILKEIRAEIARQNGIAWTVESCAHKGNCRGTCPKCEAEVVALEKALERRQALGKAVAVVGVAAAMTLSASGSTVFPDREFFIRHLPRQRLHYQQPCSFVGVHTADSSFLRLGFRLGQGHFAHDILPDHLPGRRAAYPGLRGGSRFLHHALPLEQIGGRASRNRQRHGGGSEHTQRHG